jgi:protein involved in polysaccharide export with SLBB domain
LTRALFLCLLVLALGAGCGGSKARPEADIAAVGAAGGSEPTWELPEPEPYRMTPGDVLNVKFFYYSPYDFSVVVRPDGMVTIPLMGDVKAAGVRPAELEALIRERYKDVLAEPEVAVMVMEFANQRFFVFGEVGDPGAYPLLGRMTVLDAIAQAGDVTPTGRRDDVILMRKTPDGRYAAQVVDVEAKIEGKDSDALYLLPADIVYVPMTTIGKVDEFVDLFFTKLTPAWRFYLTGQAVLDPTGEFLINR